MSESLAADEIARGTMVLAQLRAATTGICDVIPRTTEDDFDVSSATRFVGNALLVDSLATALEYDRTPAHVARGGLDHYHITLCLSGEMWFGSGRRDITLRPGDIGLLDMAQPNRTVLGGEGRSRTRLMALILPRAALAPRLAHPDSATASHLAASHHLHGCWPAISPRCGSRRSPKRAMLTRRSTRWPTSSPASRDARQIDLAIDLQFSSDSTFVRAFRRQFGCTPGEIREMSEVWLRDTGTEPGPDDLLNQIGRR